MMAISNAVRFEGLQQTNSGLPARWEGRVSLHAVGQTLAVEYGRDPGALTVFVGEDEGETVHLERANPFEAEWEEIAPAVRAIAAGTLLGELSEVDFVDPDDLP